MLLLEARESLVYLVQRAYLVQGQTYDTRLFGQSLQNRLADPPYGVRDKFETSRLVEFLGGLDEAEIAFVDEVGQAESLVLVLFGYRHHETKIGFRQFVQRLLIAFAYALGQFHLFFYRNQILLAYLLQIFVKRCALTVGNRFSNL